MSSETPALEEGRRAGPLAAVRRFGELLRLAHQRKITAPDGGPFRRSDVAIKRPAICIADCPTRVLSGVAVGEAAAPEFALPPRFTTPTSRNAAVIATEQPGNPSLYVTGLEPDDPHTGR